VSHDDQPSLPEEVARLSDLLDRIGQVAFSRLDALDVAVTDLRGKLSEPAPEPDDPDEILTCEPWAATATDAGWEVLYTWVDWMADTYGVSARVLPACWPAHPGLVEELAALRAGWVQARIACATGASDQMSYWHDRCLHSLLDRIKGGTLYGLNDCAQGTHKPVRQEPRRTDRCARTTGRSRERTPP
jgi:hypothetical protein